MIDVRDIGRDFMPREEELRRPFTPIDIGRQYVQPGGTPEQVTGGVDPQATLPVLPRPVQPSIPISPPRQYTPPGGTLEQAGVPPGELGAGVGGFPYPEQWGTASDVLTEMAQTGMPGITPEYAEKAWLPYERRGKQQAAQARESAGLEGLRWSTPLAGRLEDIWGGAAERFGAGMEQMRMQDIAGQRGARLGATGQLMGLGGQYAGLPLNVAQTMMGLGGAQQQMQQQMLDRQLQEFLRTQPEYSPLLQYMQGGAQMPTGPAMYQPSFGGQMFDLSSMLGLAGQAGLFGGGGSPGVAEGGWPEEWRRLR